MGSARKTRDLANRNKILRYIFENENVTRQDIAYALKISVPTVLQNTRDLIEEHLICEAGELSSISGRKAKVVASVPDVGFSIGIDITKNHIGFLLADLTTCIVNYERSVLKFENSMTYYAEVGKMLDEFIKQSGKDRNKIIGVGISIPGGVADDGRCAFSTRNLLETNEKIPIDNFVRHIPFPCSFINDANAAAMAELRKRGGEQDAIYLSLSNGVGGALYVNGGVYAGDNQMSGEFGHMILVPNGRECYCGAHGCAAAYLTAEILSSHTGGDLAAFFEQLDQNNPEFIEIWNEYLYWLALTIYNLYKAFDCTVILGGYVGGFMQKYMPLLRQKIRALNPTNYESTYIQTGSYKMTASALGAALIWIDEYLDTV